MFKIYYVNVIYFRYLDYANYLEDILLEKDKN
jgi:hypothetical protein